MKIKRCLVVKSTCNPDFFFQMLKNLTVWCMQSLYRYTVNYRRSVIPWNSARCFYRLVVQCILCCFYSYPSQYCNINVTKYWTRKGQILESSRNKTQNMIAWGQKCSLKNCIINEVVFLYWFRPYNCKSLMLAV